ncbi:MAG TPA: sensor domain-containing diguanylate cyclase [Negativicutes bacterium]|jgi:diguanylate cyclase (GGDEF)-like protein
MGSTDAALQSLLERRNNEIASMIEIGKALTSSQEMREVLESIMKQVDRLIKPKAWSLLLVDEATGDLTFEIVVSPVSEHLLGIRLPRGKGIAGWVAVNGKPLLIPDVTEDDRFASHIDDQLSFKTRSIICVPLIIKERVVGVIELINSYDEFIFNEADMTILSTIADFAAIALENARNYKRINELVIIDDLTGLYNSRHFGEIIAYEVEHARECDAQLALVFLDLDHLKSINDTHGHLVGSRMLSELGGLIGRSIRGSDKAARYGGDEFVIILPNTGKDEAVAMANNFREQMQTTDFYSDEGLKIKLTASFGIAAFPQDGGDKKELIRAADIAMYNAKQAGRNRVCAFVGE